VNFYRTLAPKVGIRIPANYIADYDQESGFSMILVEDLGDLRFVRQFASENLSLADTTSVVETLASLHARWWNDESLGSYEWIANSSSDSQIAMSAAQYKESVEPFLNTFREFLPDGFDSFAHSFARNAVDVISRFGSGSQTLTHRDFRLDNMAFDDSAAEGTGGLCFLIGGQSDCLFRDQISAVSFRAVCRLKIGAITRRLWYPPITRDCRRAEFPITPEPN